MIHMERTTQQTTSAPLKETYAILGEQSYLRDQAVDRLKQRLQQEGDFEFNFDQFDAATASPAEIVAAANTLPFMSPYRLIIVTGIHHAKKDLLDALGSYAQKPSETTVLAVVGEKLVKSTKLYQAIKKRGGLVERSNPRKNELPSIVASLFSAHQKTASTTLCVALVESVGSDIEALNTAVTKIATYLGDRAVVRRDDIDAVIEVSAEIKMWELTEAIQSRRGADALSLLDMILAQGNTLYAIHPTVVRAVRELLVARSCIDVGDESLTAVAAALGMPDWKVKRILAGARRYSAEELRRGLARLADVEMTMKTSSEGEHAFRRWVLDFTSGRIAA